MIENGATSAFDYSQEDYGKHIYGLPQGEVNLVDC